MPTGLGNLCLVFRYRHCLVKISKVNSASTLPIGRVGNLVFSSPVLREEVLMKAMILAVLALTLFAAEAYAQSIFQGGGKPFTPTSVCTTVQNPVTGGWVTTCR